MVPKVLVGTTLRRGCCCGSSQLIACLHNIVLQTGHVKAATLIFIHVFGRAPVFHCNKYNCRGASNFVTTKRRSSLTNE